MEWRPIDGKQGKIERCLLWCADADVRTREPKGIVMGRITSFGPIGDGMNGDWVFTHYMPLPKPPKD